MSNKRSSEITLSRLAATALAAITAAFLGSSLGTAGTVIGAGVASLVSTVAAALYQQSLDRTGNRVRSRVTQSRAPAPTSTAHTQADPAPIEPVPTESGPIESVPTESGPISLTPIEPAPTESAPIERTPRRLRVRTAAALTALAFVVGMAVVTSYELLTHGPISGGDNGTTISSLFGQPTANHPPTHPTTTPTQPSTTTPPPTSQPPTTTPTPLTPTPTTTEPTPTTSPTTTAPPTTTQPLPNGEATHGD